MSSHNQTQTGLGLSIAGPNPVQLHSYLIESTFSLLSTHGKRADRKSIKTRPKFSPIVSSLAMIDLRYGDYKYHYQPCTQGLFSAPPPSLRGWRSEEKTLGTRLYHFLAVERRCLLSCFRIFKICLLTNSYPSV